MAYDNYKLLNCEYINYINVKVWSQKTPVFAALIKVKKTQIAATKIIFYIERYFKIYRECQDKVVLGCQTYGLLEIKYG